MKSVADPAVLESLVTRLKAITPESARRWGTLTPQEMLCHLGDATSQVLGERPAVPPARERRRRFIKWFALSVPLPWPKGYPTRASLDPKRDGTKPAEFRADLDRAVTGLRRVAAAGPGELVPAHGVFGTMTTPDWHKWAYRHTDHHLRQFGA